MATADDIFQKQFEYIDELISESRFKEAYAVCGDILHIDPLNSKAKKHQRRIEDLIDQHNKEFVKKEIGKLEAARKEGYLDEVATAAQKLVQALPEDKTAVDYLAKIQKEYRIEREKQQTNAMENYKKQISDLIAENKLESALKLCNQFIRENPNNKTLISICRDGRKNIVEEKLKAMKPLFKTDKYEEILNALYALKNIEETTRVKDLIIDYTERLRDKQVEEKHDFILKAKEDISFLFQMKKYQECIIAAQELLRIDSKNSFAKNIIASAQKKLDKQTHSEVLKQMDASKEEEDGIKI